MNTDGCLTRSQKQKQEEATAGTSTGSNTETHETATEQEEADEYRDAQDDESIHLPEDRAREATGGSTPELNQAPKRPTPLITDKNVSTFRILRKLTKGTTRAIFNKNKLENLVREGRLPKGLGVRRFPLNVPSASLALQIKWDEAHTRLSRELTLLMIEYWEEREYNLNKDIADLTRKLRNESTQEEFQHIEQLLHKYTEETEDELRRREEERKKKVRKESNLDEPEEEENEEEDI